MAKRPSQRPGTAVVKNTRSSLNNPPFKANEKAPPARSRRRGK